MAQPAVASGSSGGGDASLTDEKVAFSIKSPDGSAQWRFTAKRTSLVKMAFKPFCQKTGLNIDEVRFMFDGRPIGGNATFESIGLENDDEIDTMVF